MNRLRHAYLEMVPSLEPYVSASQYDDPLSTLSAYGSEDEEPGSTLRNVLHGLTTMPGMIALINGVVAGALATSVALLLGASTAIGITAGVVGFVVVMLVMSWIGLRGFVRQLERTDVRFPRPPTPPSA